MAHTTLAKYLNPWKFRREQAALRLRALRERDGDACRRCRRPMRFDLPPGHDAGARIDRIVPAYAGGSEETGNLCLIHGRCNAKAGDDTEQVQERVRLKAEAELFERSRQRRRA